MIDNSQLIMIRNNVISGLILFLILALNGLTIFNINKRYVDFLTETLLMQSQQCGEHMENTLLLFSSDINQELDKYHLFRNFWRSGQIQRGHPEPTPVLYQIQGSDYQYFGV